MAAAKAFLATLSDAARAKATFAFDEIVEMVGGVSVEITAVPFNRHFAQQAYAGELVEGIVDGGKRYRKLRRNRFVKKPFCCYMAV